MSLRIHLLKAFGQADQEEMNYIKQRSFWEDVSNTKSLRKITNGNNLKVFFPEYLAFLQLALILYF